MGVIDLLTKGMFIRLSEGTRARVVNALVGFSECTRDEQMEYSVVGLIEGGSVGPIEDIQARELVGE